MQSTWWYMSLISLSALLVVAKTQAAPQVQTGWLLPTSANDSVNVLTVSFFTEEGKPWPAELPAITLQSNCESRQQAIWLEQPYRAGHQVSQAYLAKGCVGVDTVRVTTSWQGQTSAQLISLPLTNGALTNKARLGQQLFFDKRLSVNGALSCASCHQPANGYASTIDSATERGGSTLQHSGFRNTPSATYAALIPRFGFLGITNQQGTVDNLANGKLGTPRRGQTWDGRSANITNQPIGPLLSPFEMAHSDASSVLQTLLQLPAANDYRQVFGRLSSRSDPQLVLENVAAALGAFETEDRSFSPFNSKFDAVSSGQANFTVQEANGFALFSNASKGACLGCHDSTGLSVDSPQLFTDLSYRVLAVPRNWQIVYNDEHSAGAALDSLATSTPATSAFRNGHLMASGQHTFYDLGFCGPFRTDSLLDPTLCGAFRAAPLRNAALRRHYFHNGVYTSLADVVRFYILRDLQPGLIYRDATGLLTSAYNDLPAEYHANIVRNRNPFTATPTGSARLTAAEINDIVSFICTLTDGFEPRAPQTYRLPPQCIAAQR